MLNKHVLVVGGTKGIGAGIVKAVSERIPGAHVSYTGRSKPGREIPNSTFIESDVSTVRGAKNLGALLQGKDFDTVVMCVGIMTGSTLERNSEGLETDLATSYLSRFVLMQDLVQRDKFPKLKRVFIYGYPGQNVAPTDIEDLNFEHTPYKQWPAHMNTVVMNEALVFETKRRFPHLDVFGMNPGLIVSNIRDNATGGKSTWLGWMVETLVGWFSPTAEQYAENTILPILLKEDWVSPRHFSKSGGVVESVGWVSKPENQKRAWEVSEVLVNKTLEKY